MVNITHVKYVLNVRQSDYVVAFGMGHSSRALIESLLGQVEVVAGILAHSDEKYLSEGLKTAIFSSPQDIGGIGVFDKVYCNYCQLPTRKQNHASVLSLCFDLCAENGLTLIENMHNKTQIQYFIRKNNIEKYWFMNNGCDLLFKKDNAGR